MLLEPIVNVRVRAPEAYTGDLVSDLNGKRAHVLGITPEDRVTVIDAQAPLAEMQRYATDLRSLTQGRATLRDQVRPLRRGAGPRRQEGDRGGGEGAGGEVAGK